MSVRIRATRLKRWIRIDTVLLQYSANAPPQFKSSTRPGDTQTTMPTANFETGEATPLLKGEKPELKEMKSENFKEKAVVGIAGVAFVTSLLCIAMESHPAVVISGILSLVVSFWAAVQQQNITNLENFQQSNDTLAEEVKRLTQHNSRLQMQIKTVQTSAERLKPLEDTLDSVNELQGAPISKLEEQLAESQEYLSRLQNNPKAIVLQTLTTILLANDADQDMMLSDTEIDTIIHNLKEIPKVQLQDDLLRKIIIDNGRSVGAVMEVARNVVGKDSVVTFVP